jgi:hypothetical protein
MSEREKTKRRFWQLHRGTAVLLTIALSGIVWLNILAPVHVRTLEELSTTNYMPSKSFGWPHRFLFRMKSLDYWMLDELVLDAVVTLVILALIATSFECLIRQRWSWRIHLSTAILLMLFGGILLCANLREERVLKSIAYSSRQIALVKMGFPYRFVSKCEDQLLSTSTSRLSDVDLSILLTDRTEIEESNRVMILDIAISGGLLLAMALACEWLIRRREGRKP